MYSLSKKYAGFCYVFQDLLKSYVKLDQLEGILQFFGPKNVLLSFSSELSFYPKKRRMTPKQFFSFFLYLTGKYDRQSLTKRQAPKYYIFHLGRQSKNSNIRNLEKVPKHYRSPSQTKTFFSTLSERTLCCCCLLPKFLNEGRGLVESAFFLFLFFFIHFPCSYLGNVFPHCQSDLNLIYFTATPSTRLWYWPSTITTDSPPQINRVRIQNTFESLLHASFGVSRCMPLLSSPLIKI